MGAAQVSASISPTTKEKLDRFTARLGLKKNFVVEQALLYYMASRLELPDEALIPTRVVLRDEDFDALAATLEADVAPTEALRALMQGGDG